MANEEEVPDPQKIFLGQLRGSLGKGEMIKILRDEYELKFVRIHKLDAMQPGDLA